MITVRTHDVAGAAYEHVDARRDEAWKKQYGALAHKLPGMILQNGLAQATGFLLAKGNCEHLALLDDLNAVLRTADALPADTADGRALHDLIIGSKLTETMHLTRRSLEASTWIKRYVQGVLRVDATGDQVAEGDGGAHGDRS